MAVSFELRMPMPGDRGRNTVGRSPWARPIGIGETLEAPRGRERMRRVRPRRGLEIRAKLVGILDGLSRRFEPRWLVWRRLLDECPRARDAGSLVPLLQAAGRRLAPGVEPEFLLGDRLHGGGTRSRSRVVAEIPLRAYGDTIGTLACVLLCGQRLAPGARRELERLAGLAGLLLRPGASGGREVGQVVRRGVDPSHWAADPSTGLPGRDYLEAYLARALGGPRAMRLALAMVAPEGFEAVRREQGEEMAESAMALVARAVCRTLRASDPVVRLEPGRLVAVLPGLTSASSGSVGAMLERTIAEAGVTGSTPFPLTARVSLVFAPAQGRRLDELLAASDRVVEVRSGTGEWGGAGGVA